MPIEAFIIAIFGIFAIFIALPLLVTKTLASTASQGEQTVTDSIGVAELETLVEHAVERSIEPVQHQLDRIEGRLAHLEAKQLPAGQTAAPPQLDAPTVAATTSRPGSETASTL